MRHFFVDVLFCMRQEVVQRQLGPDSVFLAQSVLPLSSLTTTFKELHVRCIIRMHLSPFIFLFEASIELRRLIVLLSSC